MAPSHDPPASPSGLSLLQVLRLGLFQGCLGTMAVVFAGLLNRIMLTELAFPGLLVGGALAFEQLVAPSRVLFGQVSDARPFQGRYRVPYVVTGSVLYCLIAVLSVPLIFFVGNAIATDNSRAFWGGATALCGLFALFGLAVAMATTPYLALVIDRTTEQERPRAVGIIWCMLTVGIIVGAICISITLGSVDGVTDPAVLQPALQRFMIQLALVVVALTIVACWGMEPRGGSRSGNRPPEQVMTLPRTWALLTSSRQTFVFFGFLVLFALGVFLQDPILESYGADVFGLPISKSTILNALWGTGTLLGLLLAGFLITPRLGKMACSRLGCQLTTFSLALLLLAGCTGQVPVLQVVMVLFGLAAGIATNATLSLMLDLTLPEAAGTFVGAWALAQALSRALGKLMGGGLLDLGHALIPDGLGANWLPPAFPAYGFVLFIEVLIMAAATWSLGAVRVHQFRGDTAGTLAKVLALELD
ncbi:MAG: BCD family MFS transporter [Synechococcus sp. SB0668_bin_15]|nr:BCD family MFS transporter [Synechococcus sp. SB0668_bin_15]MYC50614.1 BCD family MFS transporter [Synechococcus sp. SB0662_bin_14]